MAQNFFIGMALRKNEFERQVNAVHEYLDKHAIPREDSVGSFTIIHRIKLLEQKYLKSLSEIESYYIQNKPLVD